MEEVWKDIRCAQDRYQISNKGRVRSKERFVTVTYWNRYKNITVKRRVKQQLLSPRDNGRGYMNVNLQIDGKQKTKYIHALLAEHFIPNPENKKQVNHKNGIKGDNRIENLEWVTPRENINHALDNGLINTGERHHTSKLSNKDVRQILIEIRDPDKSYRDIADRFGICKQTITNIKHGKTYKSVPRTKTEN